MTTTPAAPLTAVTEIVTGLGMLAPTLAEACGDRPDELVNVGDDVWAALVAGYRSGEHADAYRAAFANGRYFLTAADGLAGRPPRRLEWRGPQRVPGDDVVPADLRADYVYLVSCKYLSKVLLNPGPPRLFDRLLRDDERSAVHWFAETAPVEFARLYAASRQHLGLDALPEDVALLDRAGQRQLKSALSARSWPDPLVEPWAKLCAAVASESARRWSKSLAATRDQLRLLWRLLRITQATYFVLGTDRNSHLRLRVDSMWDWSQAYDLERFSVSPRRAGQPEVRWQAAIRRRRDAAALTIDGHVEVRWSHGRFYGSPEAKIYLDTPLADVPGYQPVR